MKLKNPIFETRPPDGVPVLGAKVLGSAGQGLVVVVASKKVVKKVVLVRYTRGRRLKCNFAWCIS